MDQGIQETMLEQKFRALKTFRELLPYGLLDDSGPGESEERAGFPVRPEYAHVFLCGNPGMIEVVKERLAPLGFVLDRGKVSGSLHVEEYW